MSDVRHSRCLAAAEAKLTQTDGLIARRAAAVGLGVPAYRDIAVQVANLESFGFTGSAFAFGLGDPRGQVAVDAGQPRPLAGADPGL